MKKKYQIVILLGSYLDVFRASLIIILFLILNKEWIYAQENQTKQVISKEQQERLDLMKTKGVEATLTILPVRLAGEPNEMVSEIVGALLEKQGLKNIELGKIAFNPLSKLDLNDLADSTGQFVINNPPSTEYILYAEMNGDRQRQIINELIGIVVDKTGAIVWTDILNSEDEAFKQVSDPDPLGYSVLLVQRLSPQMGLNDETARNAKPGKMATMISERSGVPPENELSLLPERQKLFRENLKNSKLIIFPPRVNGEANKEGAKEIAKMINDANLCKAEVSNDALLLKSSTEGPNEMRKLWDMARAFRDYNKQNLPKADYVLYADYAIPGYVHFVVCNQSGDWVIADLQNSTMPDFRSFDISTVDGCNKLVVERLQQHYLKESIADIIKETIQNSGIDDANLKFQELKTNKAGYYLSEDEMNSLGYEYLYSNRVKEAIATFQMNTEAFPNSFNVWDSLGEAYAVLGEKELAIKSYEKSLELNPDSQSGIEALAKLKAK